MAEALHAFEFKKAHVLAELKRVSYAEGPLTVQRWRLQQQGPEYARLRAVFALQAFDMRALQRRMCAHVVSASPLCGRSQFPS